MIEGAKFRREWCAAFLSLIFAIGSWCGFLGSVPCHGQPVLFVDHLPSTYVPGEPVSFELRLAGAERLGAYGIDFTLSSSMGAAGSGFHFDTDATGPDQPGYVFQKSDYFFDAAFVESVNLHRLTLTDFHDHGVDTYQAANDFVSTVTFRTAPSFSSDLMLAIDPSALILDAASDVPTPIAGFDTLQTSLATSGRWLIRAVPEPNGSAWLAFLLTLQLREWKRRSNCVRRKN